MADEDAQAFYGRWAHLYDLLATRTPGIVTLRRQAALACRLEPGDTVVEMGCGTGANLPYLREQVGSEGTVIGLDFTRGVLERARVATAEYDNVHVVRADATQPPIPDEDGVDAILATFVVGMLDEPARAVDQWCDALAPGGHLVLVNAGRSERWYAPPVNALFGIVVALSTPPTTRLRYDRDLSGQLDRKVRDAHDRLRARASAVAHETYAGGVVRLTGGRID
ncbi:class I SAM-dependent methyltransferase [Saliphagus sp. GCM10025334]